MKPLLIIGGGGLIVYYLYKQGYLSSLASVFTPGVTVTPVPTGTNSGTTAGAGTPPTPSQLATIYTHLVANAQAPGGMLTPYQWNYSLAIVAPSVTPPDPQALPWPQGLSDSTPMTAPQYWAVVKPYLTATFGLSGLGAIVPVGWA